MLRLMGKGTATAVLDPIAGGAYDISRRPQAVRIRIHRAETKQTIEALSLHISVTWIIPTIFIFKIFITVFHYCTLYTLFRLPHQYVVK